MENKKDGDDLFDRLNTSTVNEYLRELMDGLTAKVSAVVVVFLPSPGVFWSCVGQIYGI